MSSTAPLPWDQQPFYLEAVRRTRRAGDPTAYVDPPKSDTTNGDITTFVVGQARWSVTKLPDILYLIDPPPSRTAFKQSPKPLQKRDSRGNQIWEQWPMNGEQPRPILDYAVLPDQISSNVQWWRIEAWHRLEPRMQWGDIIMRMRPKDGVRDRSVQVDTRALNVRIFGRRKAFSILSWGGKPGKAQGGIRAKLNARLAPSNPNSSRGITPGLIDPNGPDTAANRVPLPNKRVADQTQGDQEDQTEEDQVTAAATAPQDAASDDDGSESDTEVKSRPRSEIEILADRLLIVATKGPRVLEPGASDNFEDYSPISSSGDESTIED